MNREDLEHIIRAAGDLTHWYEFVVVGSQAILGAVPSPPARLTASMEADIYPRGAEHLGDLIDQNMGEGSPFHEQYGYYAQGIDSSTAKVPAGWEGRLVRVQSAATNLRLGLCLEPTDLFLSKCYANREKDIDFNRELLRWNYVQVAVARSRVADMPITPKERELLQARITRLVKDLRDFGIHVADE